MPDQLTIDLVDKVREAQRAVETATANMDAAHIAHNDAKEAWQKAGKEHRRLQTELNMAVEQRHPEQKEGDA